MDIYRDIANEELSAKPLEIEPLLGRRQAFSGRNSPREGYRMRKFLGVGGVVYLVVATFITTGHYLHGNNSAYSTQVSLAEAMGLGLSWPWELLQVVGLGA